MEITQSKQIMDLFFGKPGINIDGCISKLITALVLIPSARRSGGVYKTSRFQSRLHLKKILFNLYKVVNKNGKKGFEKKVCWLTDFHHEYQSKCGRAGK